MCNPEKTRRAARRNARSKARRAAEDKRAADLAAAELSRRAAEDKRAADLAAAELSRRAAEDKRNASLSSYIEKIIFAIRSGQSVFQTKLPCFTHSQQVVFDYALRCEIFNFQTFQVIARLEKVLAADLADLAATEILNLCAEMNQAAEDKRAAYLAAAELSRRAAELAATEFSICVPQ